MAYLYSRTATCRIAGIFLQRAPSSFISDFSSLKHGGRINFKIKQCVLPLFQVQNAIYTCYRAWRILIFMLSIFFVGYIFFKLLKKYFVGSVKSPSFLQALRLQARHSARVPGERRLLPFALYIKRPFIYLLFCIVKPD
jgi:hypothetical protein